MRAIVISVSSKQGCFTFPEYSRGLAQLAGNQTRSQEITNKVVLNFRSTPEVLRNLRESKYGCRRLQTRLFYISGVLRKSCATCGKPNTVAGDYKQGCFTFPANAGSLAQSAGNEMHFQIMLVRNSNGEFLFLLLDVYSFSFSETQFIKPFSSEANFRNDDELIAAFLKS